MVMKNPCHYPDLRTTDAFSSSRSDGVNLAVGLWCLNIKCNHRFGKHHMALDGIQKVEILLPRSGIWARLKSRSATGKPVVAFIFQRPSTHGSARSFSPVASATIEPGWRITPHTTFIVIHPWPLPWSVQSSLRDGGNI